MRLTPEQERIVAHPLEPLRVTAGAGTGKTQTMTMRLVRLVTDHDIAPEEALGITFTNKAAEELADRLRTNLPDHTAAGHEVQVQTYHGFAHGLLREFGPLIGIPRQPRIVPPGYARQMLLDALGDTPHRALDLTRSATIVEDLQRLASSVGDHLVDLSTIADDDADPEDDVLLRRSDMVAVLKAYARRKQELGAVDYADMVALACRLVDDAAIAERIQNRYRVVLLDEYQDTNPGQRELLRRVFGGGFPVTAVGDPDQTIYEWRGASPANFEDFPHHFPLASGAPSPSLPLSVNWRSGPEILTVANAVRAEISRAGDIDELRARTDAPPATVRTHWLRTALDEAAWIADEAVRLHATGRQWSDLAILFRKHRQMAAVRDALVARGVPVEVASLGGLLEVPEVADLHAWLRLLGRPQDGIALARILTGASFRLGLGDLAPLARWAERLRRRADEDEPLGWALVDALEHVGTIEGLSDEARRRLARFMGLHRDLVGAAQSTNLAELCRLILDRTGAWAEVDALGDTARLTVRLNLYRLLDLVESWSPLEGAPSLTAFLQHLDLLAEDGAEDGLDTANVSGEDAVLLITVHRAKGLEWPVVFLPALCDGTFPGNVVTYEDPLSRPEVLPYRFRLDQRHLPDLGDDPEERKELLRERHRDQEWRTAYVAVTRAREELVASGAFWYTTGRPKQPSPLFSLIDTIAVAEPDRSEDPGEAPTSLIPETGWRSVPDPLFADGWQRALAEAVVDPATVDRAAGDAGLVAEFEQRVDALQARLDGLPASPEPDPASDRPRMSVSGVVTFAACPQRHHWAYVDRLPRRPSPAARHGVDVHKRIERRLRGIQTFDDLDGVVFSADDAEVASARGAASAYSTFQASRFASLEPLLVEAPFSLKIGDTRIEGRIDAVFETPDGVWEIVDFKSGRPSDDPTRRVQLQAYALAVARAGLVEGRRPGPLRGTFLYLGEDEPTEVSEDVDDAWLDEAAAAVADVVARAGAGETAPTPSPGCRWCDFSRFCPAGTAWLADNAAD
ncbi:MAG: ATP-dependent DNA helicase [Acidimicrobiia bacterium]